MKLKRLKTLNLNFIQNILDLKFLHDFEEFTEKFQILNLDFTRDFSKEDTLNKFKKFKTQETVKPETKETFMSFLGRVVNNPKYHTELILKLFAVLKEYKIFEIEAVENSLTHVIRFSNNFSIFNKMWYSKRFKKVPSRIHIKINHVTPFFTKKNIFITNSKNISNFFKKNSIYVFINSKRKIVLIFEKLTRPILWSKSFRENLEMVLLFKLDIKYEKKKNLKILRRQLLKQQGLS